MRCHIIAVFKRAPCQMQVTYSHASHGVYRLCSCKHAVSNAGHILYADHGVYRQPAAGRGRPGAPPLHTGRAAPRCLCIQRPHQRLWLWSSGGSPEFCTTWVTLLTGHLCLSCTRMVFTCNLISSPVHVQRSSPMFANCIFCVVCVVLVCDMCDVGVVWQGSELGPRHGEGGVKA